MRFFLTACAQPEIGIPATISGCPDSLLRRII
jgi:hypothetical protein